MTNEEALKIFQAGQALLEAIYPHCDDRALTAFDEALTDLYQNAGISASYCDGCEAATPEQLLYPNNLCPNCQEKHGKQDA